MAEGMKALEGVSWGTIGAGLLIMAVMVGIFVVALWALGSSAPAAAVAIPILLGIGAAMLLVGAAAWLMGMGIKLAAEGLAAMHQAAVQPGSPPLYLVLPMVAIGIAMVGWAAMVAAPGLLILGYVAMGLAIALRIAAPALQALAAIIQNISAEQIVEFSQALLSASWRISLAIVALIPALLLVWAVAPMLVVAGVTLLIAGAAFGIAAMLIGYGAKLLGEGMKSLGEGAVAFQGVNFVWMAGQLLVGGLMLWAAGGPFMLGATLVGIGALLLGYGLQALGPGAKALSDVDFAAMAFDLMVGGMLLWVAGMAFAAGGAVVGSGALILGLGLLLLGKGAQTLKDVDFSAIAAQLAAGGTYLVFAAVAFSLGANLIGLAAMTLGVGLWLLGKGAKQLEDLDFETVSKDLAMGAAWLIKAAWPLLYASMVLLPAGYAILWIGMSIWAGGYLLKTGAINLWTGAFYLHESSEMLWASGLMISASSGMLREGASRLFIAALYLGAAALPLGVAGAALLPASLSLYLGLKALSKSVGALDQDAINEFYVSVFRFKIASDRLRLGIASIKSAVATTFNVSGLGEQLESVTNMLDKYAVRLEAVAERISIAIMTKVVPAMQAAEAAGIQEAIKSEAITEVQVMMEKEGEEDTTDLIEQTNLILSSIDGRLEAMAADATVANILDTLNAILPAVRSGGEGELSSEMNAWMK
jgi:hypothetical protein